MLPVSKISEIEVLDAKLLFEAMFFAPRLVTIGQEIRGGEQFRYPKTASKVSTHTKLYMCVSGYKEVLVCTVQTICLFHCMFKTIDFRIKKLF